MDEVELCDAVPEVFEELAWEDVFDAEDELLCLLELSSSLLEEPTD